jgi:uncharacterized protein with PQ loop repeat
MNINDLIELRSPGFNLSTFNVILTLFFTLAEMYGLVLQNRKIITSKSGQSVSNSLMVYFMFMFFSYFIYGIHKHEAALTFNGLIFIFFIPIIINLKKFKGLSGTDIFIGIACFLVLTVLSAISMFESMFIVFSIGGIFALLTQPLLIIFNRTAGEVEIKTFAIYFASNFCWILYGIKFGDKPLASISLISLIILGSILVSGLVYKNSPSSQPDLSAQK